MANELLHAGAQSATFKVPSVDDYFGLLTKTDWAKLPSGKLKRLLNKSYGEGNSEPISTAFFDAFSAAGGTVQILGRVTDSGVWTAIPAIIVDTDGYPVVTGGNTTQAGQETRTCYIHIQVGYSGSE
jgi:hypothetical protein